jgi:hypothetical protein
MHDIMQICEPALLVSTSAYNENFGPMTSCRYLNDHLFTCPALISSMRSLQVFESMASHDIQYSSQVTNMTYSGDIHTSVSSYMISYIPRGICRLLQQARHVSAFIGRQRMINHFERMLCRKQSGCVFASRAPIQSGTSHREKC